ncbi:hypothetical protein B0G81_3946 [Paraburkholderia sp. BL6665CI2N2]|uniref:hypothetical protein n=1 Tax=Paraburkholderia sp. BL6665CI2N2 TaxID=1938806 RepID=UPI001065315F|nr:hypothetical protein [Paraburkholderia sp. BL6665CI2N2]TDY23566.1 hypothetical protein B0G81_3946 [Paraburkholderia sp. BL6665CI2N2]
MFRPLRERKFPQLTRKGFLVHKPERNVIEAVSATLRHPLLLIVAGFILTGMVGTALQYQHQENEKSKDAVAKSMDDVRKSIDDFAGSFSEYDLRTNRLLWVMSHKPTQPSLDKAVEQYDASFSRWLMSREIDTTIVDHAVSERRDTITGGYWSNIEAASKRLDACIEENLASPGPAYINFQPAVICHLSKEKSVSAPILLGNIARCVRVYVMAVRPNPRNDFESFSYSFWQSKMIAAMDAYELPEICNDSAFEKN